MEGDKTADNEKELTSTSSSDMGKLLSTNKEEKNDSNDTLPTSSTDASTSVKSTDLASDDPISSTSSEMDSTKAKTAEKSSTDVLNTASTFETEELLDVSMAAQPTERIEENVDDLVSDLETLLGESTGSFNLPFKATEAIDKTEVSSAIEDITKLLEDKPEDEVSSNTNSSTDKNLNLGETSTLKVEKSGEESKNVNVGDPSTVEKTVESVQHEQSPDAEEAAKDNEGGGDFASGDNSIMKDNTNQSQEKEFISDTKEPIGDDKEDIKETSSGDISEEVSQEKEEIADTEEPSIKDQVVDPISIEAPSDISPKRAEAVEDINEENSESKENIVQECPDKADKIIIEESIGDLTSNDKEDDVIEKVELCKEDEASKSEEPSIEESTNLKVEEINAENIKECSEGATQQSTDNNEHEMCKEIPEIAAELGELSTKEVEDNVGSEHVKQNDQYSVEIDQSDTTRDQNQEEPETLAIADSHKSKDNQEKPATSAIADSHECKDDTKLVEESNEKDDTVGSPHEQCSEHKEVSKSNEETVNSDINNQDISLVQQINDGAQEDSESSASKKDSTKVEDKTDIVDASKDDPKETKSQEDVHAEETIYTGERTVLEKTEYVSKEVENKQDMKDLQDELSSTNIAEESINNEPENINQAISISESEVSKQTDNMLESKEIECTVTHEDNMEINESVKCTESQLEEPNKTSEREEEKRHVCTDEFKESEVKYEDLKEAVNIPLEQQAHASKHLPELQEECTDADNCGSVQAAESNKESLKSDSVKSIQEIYSENPDIPQSIENRPTTEDIPEKIEISELADTSEAADVGEVVELEPLVVEPEDEPQSLSKTAKEELQNLEVTEVHADESKLPVIIEDQDEKQKEQAEIVQAEKMELEESGETVLDSEDLPEKSVKINDQQDVQAEVVQNIEDSSPSDSVIKTSEENILNQSKEDPTKENLFESEFQVGTIQEKNELSGNEDSSIFVSGLSNKATELVDTLKKPTGDEPNDEESETVQNKMDPGEALEEMCIKETNETLVKKVPTEVAEDDVDKVVESQTDAEQNKCGVTDDLQIGKCNDLLESVGQNIEKPVKDIIEPLKKKVIEEVITEKQQESMGNIIMGNTHENLNTVNLCEQKQSEIVQKAFREDVSFVTNSVNEVRKEKRKIEPLSMRIEESKSSPEINIRRKTVEQDLEKIVCLSEESSDSDTSEEASRSLPKSTDMNKESDCEQDALIHDVPMTDDLPPNQEESDLIEIAREVEQLQNEEPNEPDIPSEDSMPGIEDILSDRGPEMPVELPVDTEANLETILAVACLQNDSVPEVKVERRLSEKELREMEAIRMAVASITDSSQDTYDSYLVESSMTMDNSIPEVSSDVQEFSNDVHELSSDTQELSSDVQELYVDSQKHAKSESRDVITTGSEEAAYPKDTVIPENKVEKENRNKNEADECLEVSISSSKDQAEASDSKNETDKCLEVSISSSKDQAETSDNIAKAAASPDTSESCRKFADIDRQNNAVLTERPVSAIITEQEKEKEMSRSEKVELVNDNDPPESTQNIESNESLIPEKNVNEAGRSDIAEETKISPPKQVDIQIQSTVLPIDQPLAKEQKIHTSEDVIKESKESVPESTLIVIEKEATSQPVVEEELTTTLKPVQEKVTATEVVEEPTISPPKIVEKEQVLVAQKVEERKVLTPEHIVEEKKVLAAAQVIEEAPQQVVEERTLRNRTRRGNKISEPLSISVEEVEKPEKLYSPKITIKPLKVPDEEVSTTSDAEGNKGSLKITITKQSDKMHSILKVYNPEDDSGPPANQEEPIPKLIIKPKMQVEQQHSPKMSTRSSKVYSPTSTQRCSSPRVTIKPVVKPLETKTEAISPLKITFKPVIKPDEGGRKHSPKTSKEQEKNHNPKITIKPIPKPAESTKEETLVSTPKVTIKPIKRYSEDPEGDNEQERSSPKIIIKPVIKPMEQDTDHTNQMMPKLKIKPIKKHEDEENSVVEKDRDSPKISIKPIVKPPEKEEEDEEVKERIVLKINKGNLPTPSKDSRKREYPEEDKTEKIGKLKLKFSTTGGQTHIVQDVEDGCKRQRKDSGYSGKKDIEEFSNKRTLEEKLPEKNKRLRSSLTPDKGNEDNTDGGRILGQKLDSPIVVSEDSRSQHSADCVIIDDFHSNSSDLSKITDIASRTTHIEASPVLTVGVVTPSVSPAPKRRGRPRKVPLEVREEFKDSPGTPQATPPVTPASTPVTDTSVALSDRSEPGTPVATPSPGGRPKRSCRGQNVMATLGIKPRKPRGRGSGRGSKVNMGDREPVVQSPVEPMQTVSMKPEKEPKLTKAKLKLLQKAAEEETKRLKEEADQQAIKEVENIKRQKEEADKQAIEEAEKARQIKKEEDRIRQEEEQALKQQEEEDVKKVHIEFVQKQEEERHRQQKEEEEKQRKLTEQNRQKALEEERNRKAIELEKEKEQKALDEASQLELEKQKKIESEETRRKETEKQNILAEDAAKIQIEALKRKKEEVEGQAPLKKKKEDKTPPRKLEVTTRRQKAQLQKAAEEAERAAAEKAQKAAAEASKPVVNLKNSNPRKVAALQLEASTSTSATASEIVCITDDSDSLDSEKRVEEDKPKEKGKKTPEQKGKGKTTPEKARKLLEKARLEEEKKAEEAREAEEQKKFEERKKIEEQKKAEQERKAGEEKKVLEEKRALEQRKALEQKLAAEQKVLAEEKRAAEEKRSVEEKKAVEDKKALEEKQAELLKKAQAENKAEETSGEDKKPEEGSAEDEEESEDSEIEKQKELLHKQKKLEAIQKCRAKRMEKLAKVAEMKRKRQELATQQRAARLAAEEAERIAAEKARVNRRYGRYGTPKPQISLIDEPVRETEGTVKSHIGLFNPETEQINITQPIAIDDEGDFTGSQSGVEKPLKQLEASLNPAFPSPHKLLAPPTHEPMAVDSTEDTPTKSRRPIGSEDVMMVDEDTRMSADLRGSRSQTPAKQSIPPPDTMIEDSQGSLGTESVGSKSKTSKTPKLEVFQDLEASQVTAEQVAEYSWNGRGPFMIQEQVSLYLGIKSFKRKYPNCQRRPVDMQERDYLKENGYVTEAQCDLGLMAVNAQDILDIMYADFQDKYEEYCKVQREKQAAELADKQKALSQFTFKPGYEKLDILEQAVQSAAAWNQQFNKSRREERKAHMDLQNLTVHYPKSKTKVLPTPKTGDHPIALVPGQFTDYYKEFTPTELNNLPLNTMCYDEIKVTGVESDSDESSSGSDSDSDSSSDSSGSGSSCNDEDCKECEKHGGNDGNDVIMDNNGSNDSVVLVSVTAAPSVRA